MHSKQGSYFFALHEAIHDPERDPGRKREEHLEREIVRLARGPAFANLWQVGNCGAEGREGPDESFHVLPSCSVGR